MSVGASKILLASAGTGKTTRLTGRLLELYASGVAPERIVASTFTRKAAGEILERVFTRLCEACASESAAAELSDKLSGIELDRAKARALTCKLLRSMDRLNVSTLDAWFLQRVQQAALALGLAPDWELSDEHRERRLSARALSRSLDRPHPEEKWSTLIADLKRGGAESRVHSGLMSILGGAASFTRESPPQAWEFPPLPRAVAVQEYERAMAELGCARAPATSAGKPHSSYQSGIQKLCTLAQERRWPEFFKGSLVAGVLDGTLRYYKLPVDPALAAAIQVIAQRGAGELAGLLRAQNSALRELGEGFVEELDKARAQDRSLPFDALPRILQGHPIGAGIDHLLLDEFQDTSSIQWRALEPCVHAVRDKSQGSFFCVGDAKQSVYGWRGAESRLLTGLPERLGIDKEELNQNWRSSPAVLEAVNRVFAAIRENAALEEPTAKRAAAQFQSTFQPHVAGKKDLPGLARLWIAQELSDAATTKQRNDARIARGVELVLEIRREHPQWSIAFLLRRNTLVPPLLECLKEHEVHASGHGGNPLTDSSAVNAALSLFEFADHPGDDYLHFHLATSAIGAAAGVRIDDDSTRRAQLARELRRRWLALGPAAILDELAMSVRAGYSEFDQRRFAQLAGLCLRLETSVSLRPAEFAARLASERVPDPASAAVQVMTVHGAKGLEFDAVILLDLDSRLSKAEPSVVGRRRAQDPAEEFDVVTHGLARESAAAIPALAEVLSGARATRIEEELCVLYVSMTRAIHQLEMIVDAQKKDEPRLSFAGILRQALNSDAARPGGPRWECVRAGDGGTATKASTRVHATAPPTPAVAKLEFGPKSSAITHVAPSRLLPGPDAGAGQRRFEPPTQLTSELFRDSRAARTRGELWHGWLEGIAWCDDALPEAQSLLARTRDAADAGTNAEVQAFLAALAQPGVREELSRSAAARRLGSNPAQLELLREQRFAYLNGAGASRELILGALDRAVIARDVGRAEIVDFKTSAIPAAELNDAALLARARAFTPQMQAYREALARKCALDPTRIALRVCFVAAGRSIVL